MFLVDTTACLPLRPGCCLQASSSTLGTSPQGSFEHEWLEFMSSNIKSSRTKHRRRSQRGMGPGDGADGYQMLVAAASPAAANFVIS